MDALVKRWKELMREHKEYRMGEALFNALYELHPGHANAIRGTVMDPYYNCVKCTAVLDWISRRIPA